MILLPILSVIKLATLSPSTSPLHSYLQFFPVNPNSKFAPVSLLTPQSSCSNTKSQKMVPLILSSIFIHFIFIFTLVNGDHDSIYEILKAHGLPMGLLPKGITRFDFDDSGRFEVHLDQPCKAKFESEMLYKTNVSGTLSYGQIGALSGISALELFLWFPVQGIRVDVPTSGLIYFDVGVVSKQFSLSLFETPRDCKPGSITQDVNLLSDVRVNLG